MERRALDPPLHSVFSNALSLISLMRFLTRVAAPIAVLLLAVSALAQSAAAAKPRFLIDAIEVRGLRWASERLIVAETRLQAGREYTESELHAGAARAARLPFVVRIDLRLDKGENRGAYRLVIEVIEAKPVFLGGALRAGGDDDDDEKLVGLGGRLFAGRSGVVHGAATTGDERGFDVGYTQYDLFGTGAFVAALVSHRELTLGGRPLPPPHLLDPPSTRDRITTQFIAGVPLGVNHGLRVSWTREPTIIRAPISRVPGRKPFTLQHITTAELAYIYDSTDDPLFPSRGASFFASGATRRGPYATFTPTGPELTYYERPSRALRLRKHWEVNARQSISAAGSIRHAERDAQQFPVAGGRAVQRAILEELEAEAAYAFTIWGGDRPHRFGELRAEAGLGYQYERQVTPRPSHLGPLRTTEQSPTAHVGLVFRNPWAVFRLRLEVGE